MIVAAGVNANPNVNRSRAQAVYMTVAQAAAGGTNWATYEQRPRDVPQHPVDTAALDLTGTDPPGIPRAPGAQRVMSFGNGQNVMAAYSSLVPIAELTGWYEQQFHQLDWVLEPVTTARMREAASGVLCFITQGRVCILWLQRESEVGPTTILISVSGT